MSAGNREFDARLERIRSTSCLQVLDLFAGCGGFSLGFQKAGFRIIGGIEVEKVRAGTFVWNLRPDLRTLSDEQAATDICKAEPREALEKFGESNWAHCVDGIIGGPPCQAYARIGRAKLRDVRKDPQAFIGDPRGLLYLRYLDYVEALAPLFIVLENVPDILSVGGTNVAEIIARHLEDMGYEVRYTLLNAAGFGVPQFRERLFLIGLRRDLAAGVPRFPRPRFRLDLPSGFRGTCAPARKALELDDGSLHIVPLPDYHSPSREAVTAEEALSDLPRVGDRLKLEGKGARDLGRLFRYHSSPSEPYQRRMRDWSGFRSNGEVSAHESRYLPRDFDLFRLMEEGQEYPELHRMAVGLYEREMEELETSDPDRLTEEFRALRHRQLVPPYDAEKFPNKWRKLERNAPARTLMAHLSHDSYTHIHYDSDEARTITVREAARLQSFPDAFHFKGAMNAAFGQIGNAVPPLLAYAVAMEVKRQVLRPLIRRTVRRGRDNDC